MAAVLITGASKRIGAAIARHLAMEGHCVVLHCRSETAEAIALIKEIRQAGGTIHMVTGDLSDRAFTRGLVGEAAQAAGKPIDLLVNNASLFEDDTLDSVNDTLWDAHMEVNLHAPLVLTQAFARQLPAGQKGLIVNIIDQRVWRLNPTFFSYTLSKSALWTMTQTAAQALAPAIRVNAIGPGPVFASIHQSNGDFAGESSNVPLGKGPDAKEIAVAISFLLKTPSMTGQMLALDGGQHLSWKTPDTQVSE